MIEKSDLPKRLRASVRLNAINGDAFERGVCATQMTEAAELIEQLEQTVSDLSEAVKQYGDAAEDGLGLEGRRRR